MSKVRRFISIFLDEEGNDEGHLMDFPLTDVNLVELQSLFGEAQNNPMYDSYLITKCHESFFVKKYGLQFDFNNKIYYLDAIQE